MFIISEFPVCEIRFLCSVMTYEYNDIHITIDGSHFLVGIIESCMKGYSKHFHVETVFYMQGKLLYRW